MPRLVSRLYRALFPIFAIPVSTLPTLTEAKALAALLVSQGNCVAIRPAAHGFTVAKIGGVL